jgi:signal transduction histidine kinase
VEDLALQFFPLPHVFRGERRAGLLVEWPEICSRCDRQCEAVPESAAGDLRLCSYGLNYVRVDEDLIVAGVAIRDLPQTTLASRKRLREVGRDAVTRDELERILETCALATDAQAAELRARMDAIITEFRESRTYQQEVIELLRPDLQMTLAQVHDYKLFVQQIIQNMNVILEERYPGLEINEKLDRATHEETALYWAASLMDERLDAALYLEAPERILEPREQGTFRLHGLVLKYVRIYKSRADRNGVAVRVAGESWAEITGNSRALAIIPHTLIDNALKYAPRGTTISVRFIEADKSVTLEVEGYGPRIEPSEVQRIFDLFYRGNAARRMSSEGTGFGLASAQNVARAHDTEIVVEQGDLGGPEQTLKTTFGVTFERAERRGGSRERHQRK